MKIMKKVVAFILALGTAFSLFGCNSSGGKHPHSFTEMVEDAAYIKAEATCQSPTQYYYSCICGEKGTEFFEAKDIGNHIYTAEIEDSKYLKSAATCETPAVYYKACAVCGKKSNTDKFTGTKMEDCDFSLEIPNGEYLKSEATFTDSAVYYKSCSVCGKKGEETFSYGAPLRSDYTDEEKAAYTPVSLTVTLYDAENYVYGFTYNTQSKPLRPVIRIQEGNSLTENYEEYAATVKEATTYSRTEEGVLTYYIVKAEVELKPQTTYAYQAYDKYVGVGTKTTVLTTKDTKSTSFSFAHVSDSQMTNSSGGYLENVLSHVVADNDFIVHTGDFVQVAKYESEWTDMLHTNFEYLSKIPVMAIAGNHDIWAGYGGAHETYKHFNYNLTEQSTTTGIYYSFVYGNTKFIMLNTSNDKLDVEQYQWLESELKNNTSVWTIVATHQPLYSPGRWGSNTDNAATLALRSQLQKLLAEYGVDIVLQGHDHVISRTYPIDAWGAVQTETWTTVDDVEYTVNPKGVIYMENGPAGDQSRTLNQYADLSLYHYAEASKVRSWAEFSVDGNMLTISVKYSLGSQVKLYCQWGIQKSTV